jgi:DNA-binding transcriptional regulator YbjK
MGLDVQMWTVGNFTDKEVARLDQRVSDIDGRIVRTSDGLRWDTLMRYWAPGYERGSWPSIHAVWLLLTSTGNPVYYSDDEALAENVAPFTEADAANYWKHWSSPEGDAYGRTVAAFNADLRVKYAH